MSVPQSQQVVAPKNVIAVESIRDLFYTSGRPDVKVDIHVEECVARMTNEFVDTIMENAAIMAKMRGAGRQVALEPRDIDIAMSNLYSTSLPGLTSALSSSATAAATKRKRQLRMSVLEDGERAGQGRAWGCAMHLTRSEAVQQEAVRHTIRAERKKKKKRDDNDK